MSQEAPIQLTELFQLQSLGINQQSITFSTVTMESDKFICVRDTAGEQKIINIIDVATQKLTTNKVNAESAIMNPTSKVLALRAQNTLQIFNLEMKTKMKQHAMNEDIKYWTWISPSTIAIVTASSVFHWSMEGDSSPQKVFDRHQNLEGALIMNYRVDTSEKWLLLIGLKRGDDGSMKGLMQLYSVEKGVTQAIEGHAASFLNYRLDPSHTATLICIAAVTQNGPKLFVMEVPGAKAPGSPTFQRKIAALPLNDPSDFPVAMQVSEKHGIIYLVTKGGFLFLYDANTATLIYKNRVSGQAIFATAPHTSTNGLIGINKGGQVLTMHIDDKKLVPYLTTTNAELAVQLASYANLSGADDLYNRQFDQYISRGDVENAVRIAVDSPQGSLRTRDTIHKLRNIRTQPGQKNPLSVYFQSIIEKSKLNSFESIELAQIVLQKPQGADYIANLITQDKVESSEQLGDLIASVNPDLALKIYIQAQAHEKIIQNLIQKGDWERVLAYCDKVQYQPDYLSLFKQLLSQYRDSSVKFAAKVYQMNSENLDPNLVVDIFTQHQMIKQATAYLLEILNENRPEDAALQTRLLEINLMYSPIQVADSILGQNMFSYYDRRKVAQLCEKVGLHQRALENYEDINDYKRVILNAQFINTEWLVNFFGQMSEDETMVCLKELLSHNIRQNLNIVVQIAQRYCNELGVNRLLRLFEEYRSFEGVYYFLSSIIDEVDDPEVVFKYIEAAVKLNSLPEVERITRENEVYNPVQVKEFLKSSNLKNQNPLINVCDKHNYVEELTQYLHTNRLHNAIELYVKNRNPLKAPNVIGALLDVDASEDYIGSLLMGVGNMCPIEPLVAEVEKRNRLKILRPWLEARIAEGTQEPAAHNAIAKIYIDQGESPDEFLKTNPYYDSQVVGKYCEKRDPHLAFIAYERGQCDEELVELSITNNMFKQLARYLVRRQNDNLWRSVLTEDNDSRRQIINQVVATALPECRDAEQVSSTVRAFMAAELPNELIELLEQIVLQGNSEFKNNKSLQNLLILTAIKAESKRVMGYIEKLDQYDGPDIAQLAIEKGLYEEAFFMYNKFSYHDEALKVLIQHVADIDRASDYADNIATPQVWSILGNAELEHEPPMVPEAIESFMKANDASSYRMVINIAEREGCYKDLIRFLLMARKQHQDSFIDTELVYSYAKYAQDSDTNSLADLEDFISGPNTAQIMNVGERCFDEELYEAARILFNSISNYSRLASALVKLGRYRDAVQAATKANSIKTWKEVMVACIEAKDFRYAQSCGLNIIVHADELDDLIFYYESRGYFEEVIQLLDKGLGHERVHKGIYTNLGILYAKYKPEKMMEHIQRYYQKCHVPKLIAVCEDNELWAELAFLYRNSDERDQAVRIMMEHPIEAWDHSIFTEIIRNVVNRELHYRSVEFYLEEHPDLVNDLLQVLSSELDHERVARDVERLGELPLIKTYLEMVQDQNLGAVNEALNKLYIEEEDYETLRQSIDQFRNFEQLRLAKQLESHELLEFRRISAWLYRMNKKYADSISLSKQDKLYQDAMDTAAESSDTETAEDLLRFFVKNKLNACFAACLYNCYSFIRPDVALELAWRNNIIDMVMPFMVQTLREYSQKIDDLTQRMNEQPEGRPSAEHQPAEEYQSEYSDPSMYYSQMGSVPPGMMPPPQDPSWGAYPQQGYPPQDNTFINF